MITLSCPSCGADINFHSKASVFAVCSYCKATMVRHDMNLESLGQMADLQDDLTPLQIGTRGMYDGERFEIVGRLKVGYSEGSWNEWYVLFGTEGEEAWLAEAQGFYAICFPVAADGLLLPEPDELKVSRYVDLGRGMYQVEDIRKVRCLYSEGELPVNAMKGRESLSVDLGTADGEVMATLEYAKDETRIFIGRYVDFDDFQFQYLRHIDGW